MPDIDVNGPLGKHISSKQPTPQDPGLRQMVRFSRRELRLP